MLARIVIALGAVLLLSIAMAGAQRTPHDLHHDQYQDWLQASGASCCSAHDCHGADAYRMTPDGYEVQILGQWIAVPPQAVRPYPSPDGGAHVCHINAWIDGKFDPTILCFVRPMGV